MKRNDLVIIIILVFLAGFISYFLFNIIVAPFTNTTNDNDIFQKISNFLTPEKEQIPETDKKLYVDYAYQLVDAAFNPEIKPKNNIPELEDYKMIYITLMNNNQVRCCQKGRADINDPKRTAIDIQQAIEKCLADDRYGGPIQADEIADLEIVFNLFLDKQEVNKKNMRQEIELGVHAIEVEKDGKSVFFKESVPITKDYSLEKTLKRLCLKADWEEDCYEKYTTDIYKYNTQTFKSDRDLKITDLYRYNVLIEPEDINKELIDQRLNYVKSWFLNNINPETKTIQYQYFPSKDTYDDDNNHVRQTATIWSVTELKKYLDNTTEFDSLIDNTFNYYQPYLICKENYCYLEINGKSKIAYNAFLLMGLINTPEYSNSLDWQEKLAQGLLHQQQEDGSFYTYFNTESTSGSDFYPGEALLSLMKYYEQTNNKQYLEATEKALYYYRDYWRNEPKSAFIPWHSQAYLKLYEATKNQEVADFILELNDWLISEKQVQDSIYPDLIGGFPKPKPHSSTGVDIEGLNAAYKLAQLINDKEHMAKYKEAIEIGTRFILLLQYTPDSAIGIKNKERAIGGFRYSLTSNKQRLDLNQHCLLALIWGLDNKIFE